MLGKLGNTVSYGILELGDTSFRTSELSWVNFLSLKSKSEFYPLLLGHFYFTPFIGHFLYFDPLLLGHFLFHPFLTAHFLSFSPFSMWLFYFTPFWWDIFYLLTPIKSDFESLITETITSSSIVNKNALGSKCVMTEVELFMSKAAVI